MRSELKSAAQFCAQHRLDAGKVKPRQGTAERRKRENVRLRHPKECQQWGLEKPSAA